MKKLFIMLFVLVILPLNLFAVTANSENIDFELLSVEYTQYGEIILEWKYDSNRYEEYDFYFDIYRAESEDGEYALIDIWYDEIDETTYYVIDEVEYGQTYYYKIALCAYNYDTYNYEIIQFSNVKSIDYIPNTIEFEVVSKKKNTMTLCWEEPWKSVDGYVIYRSTKEDGIYTKIKTITKSTTTEYIDTDVKDGQKYYYKICAYIVLDGETIYGKISQPVCSRMDISRCQTFLTEVGDLTYNEKQLKKIINVKFGNTILTEGVDYEIVQIYPEYDRDDLSYAWIYINGIGKNYTGYELFLVTPINGTPFINTIAVKNYGINLSWDELHGAYGYAIYRKTGSGSYSRVKTITDKSITEWTDEDATETYTKYTYYIKAYTKNDGKNLYSDKSYERSIERVSTPKLKSITNKKEGLVVNWDSVKDVIWYAVYRKTDNGSWKCIAKTKNLEYIDKSASVGTKYTYTVCCLDGEDGKKISYYKAAGITKTRGFQATYKSESSSSLTISWNKVSNAKGYTIYRATSENGTYKKIATIKSNSTISYTDKKLSFGKYYYYKIKPYTVKDGKTVYEDYQATVKGRATTKSVTISSAKASTPTKIKLTWSKISGVDGYQIYRCDKQFGDYKKVKTIKGNSTTSYTVSNLKNGKRFYFKIRTYKKVKGTVYYSSFSDVKSHYIDKLGYKNEPYDSKTYRIWGTDYKKYYSSSKAAKKDMKTIKIKTWDINKQGKKYTRYHYLTVHKNIADTVKAIFNEIYKGKEKFPIKSVGGYSWRGDDSASEHCMGLAIDINPNENADFNGGKPTVGKYWKPGKDPYSIPEDGDVVKAFEKYGYDWGDDFYDYMHFSYFGW